MKWRPKLCLLNTWKSSNPFFLLPTLAFRLTGYDKPRARYGSVAVIWLCWELWFWLEHPERMEVHDKAFKAMQQKLRAERLAEEQRIRELEDHYHYSTKGNW